MVTAFRTDLYPEISHVQKPEMESEVRSEFCPVLESELESDRFKDPVELVIRCRNESFFSVLGSKSTRFK